MIVEQSSDHRWHGLTNAEWSALWSRVEWQRQLARALIEIALDPNADTADRCGALQTINQALAAGLLPASCFPPARDYPTLSRNVLLAIASNNEKRAWFFKARRRRGAASRLFGARVAINLAASFMVTKPERAIDNATLS